MSAIRLVHPPKRPETGIPELDQLLHPARFYNEPAEVVRDHRLTRAERRAILSSWASDACAVESCPMLRAAPYAKQPVRVEEILEALRELDRTEEKFRRLGLPQASSDFPTPFASMMLH